MTAGGRREGIERLAHQLSQGGDDSRRITVIGTVRNIGTTMTAIALARNLASQARVVLVELSVAAPNLSVIASDPASSGLSELVQGSASFGQIITRDRHSRAHLVLAGRAPIDAASLMASQLLAIAIEALARSYDHVIIDAGMAEDIVIERLATLASRAALVAAGSKPRRPLICANACSRQDSQMSACWWRRPRISTAAPLPPKPPRDACDLAD